MTERRVTVHLPRAAAPTEPEIWRVTTVVSLLAPFLLWAVSRPFLPQDAAYHQFVDQRVLFGVTHFWNVVSNLPFAAVGAAGLWWLRREGPASRAFEHPRERWAYVIFFVSAVLTCLGSGYYHADPTNQTLVWDRLALSLMLTATFAIVVGEFIGERAGWQLLGPLAVTGVLSVLYWAWTEALGRGDLRPYFLVQFYPALAIPVILVLFQSRYSHARTFWLLWLLYIVAKVAEVADRPLLEWTGLWSGHTLKHLVASVASYVPLWSLRHRVVMSNRTAAR